MYNTMTITRQISDLLVPLGIAGAVLVAVSCLVTCIMVVRRGEDIGIPVAGWIVGTMLSLAAGFSDLRPLLFSIGSGIVMAVVVLLILRAKRSSARKAAQR